MTLRGSINMASAVLILTGILFAYFTFSTKRWIEGIESRINMQESMAQNIAPKIVKIESESSVKWIDMERRLGSIETKLDRILEHRYK